MKKHIKVIVTIAAAASFALGAANSIAGGKGSNVGADKKESKEPSVVAQLALAERLIKYGDSQNDPMALILAAKIKKTHPDRDEKREKTSKGEGKDDKKADKGKDSVDAVLARARDMAKGDKGMLALADDVAAMSSRGRQGGAASTRERVLAGTTDYYNLTFKGGERAAVLVNGDHDTDLDLYVYDENGNEICKDVDNTDTMFCEWWPRWTGPFRVEIKNLGRISNIYTIRTN